MSAAGRDLDRAMIKEKLLEMAARFQARANEDDNEEQ